MKIDNIHHTDHSRSHLHRIFCHHMLPFGDDEVEKMRVEVRNVLAYGNVIVCPTCIRKIAFRKEVTASAGGYTSMMTAVVAMMSGESV